MITKELNSALRDRTDQWGQPSIAFYVIQVMDDNSIQGRILGNYAFSGSEDISMQPSFINKEIETEFHSLEQAGIEALGLSE